MSQKEKIFEGYPESMLHEIWQRQSETHEHDFPWIYQSDTDKLWFAKTVRDGAAVGLYPSPPK